MSASSVPATSATARINGRRSSPPPPSLERKFELLEARFTQPIGLFGNANVSNNNNNNSFSSPRGGRSSSNNNLNNIHNENSNLSEHSFSFSGSNHSVPTMNVRSKRSSATTTSLDIVSRAAARHMRKVAATSPVTAAGLGVPTTATSNFSFSSNNGNSNGSPGTMNNSDSSNSQQTVVTGNKTTSATNDQQEQPQQQHQQQQLSQQSHPPNMNIERVVAESPPVLISPTKTSTKNTKPKVARALQISSNTNNNNKDDQQPQQQPKHTGSATVSLLLLFSLN